MPNRRCVFTQCLKLEFPFLKDADELGKIFFLTSAPKVWFSLWSKRWKVVTFFRSAGGKEEIPKSIGRVSPA